MARKAYTTVEYQRDKAFLKKVKYHYNIHIDPTLEDWVEIKRRLLVERCGEKARIKPLEARAEQIHRVFHNVYRTATRRVEEYEARDIRLENPFLDTLSGIIELEGRKSYGLLGERIAIMLDSCTEDEHRLLTRKYGKPKVGVRELEFP